MRGKNKKHDERAPGAAAKLEEKGRNVVKLTMKEIEAFLFRVYKNTMGGSNLRKPDYVKALEKEMESSIGKYEDFLRLLAAGDDAAVIPSILDVAEDTDEVEEEDAADLDLVGVNDMEEDGVERNVADEAAWDAELVDASLMGVEEGDAVTELVRSARQRRPTNRHKECHF